MISFLLRLGGWLAIFISGLGMGSSASWADSLWKIGVTFVLLSLTLSNDPFQRQRQRIEIVVRRDRP